jgi:hypothetical protein
MQRGTPGQEGENCPHRGLAHVDRPFQISVASAPRIVALCNKLLKKPVVTIRKNVVYLFQRNITSF